MTVIDAPDSALDGWITGTFGADAYRDSGLRSVELVVYGEAKPAGSKRHIGGGRIIDDNPKAREWKNQIAQIAGRSMEGQDLLEGPLALKVVFYLPRPKGHFGTGRNEGQIRDSAPKLPTTKPDTTKLLRAVEDALTGIAFRDDAQVVEQVVTKLYGSPVRVEIGIHEVL